MKRNFLKIIVPAVVVVLIVLLLIWVVSTGLGSFRNASDNVKAASIAALVTVFTFFAGRLLEQSRDRKQKINQEKIAVYKKFIDTYFYLFMPDAVRGGPVDQDRITKELVEFQKDLIFWGSDDVLQKYIQFRLSLAYASSASAGPEVSLDKLAESIKASAELLKSMRRDIGYSFTTFNAKQLGYIHLQVDAESIKLLKRL